MWHTCVTHVCEFDTRVCVDISTQSFQSHPDLRLCALHIVLVAELVPIVDADVPATLYPRIGLLKDTQMPGHRAEERRN